MAQPGREIDPLLVKDHRTANILQVKGPSTSSLADNRRMKGCCPRGRSALTLTALMTVILMSGALIFLFVVMEDKKVLDNGPVIVDESELPEDQVQVDVSSSGVYSVKYMNSNIDTTTLVGHPVKKVFADLAQSMLPPWYTASRMAMNDILQHEKMDPSNVKNARTVLLTTRDLLDVFSPVYPTRSIWGSVRNLYKEGYELVGYYQDLDHAHVAFSKDLWEQRKIDVLKWKKDFESFDSRHDIHSFLSKDVDMDGCYNHKESHLFWAELEGFLPCGRDIATDSLQKLALVQLHRAMDLLTTIMTFYTVLDVDEQEMFHEFRKEIRSVLDEWDLFGTVLFPTADSPESSVATSLNTLRKAFKKLGAINDNWTAYNLYLTKKQHQAEQKELASEIVTAWGDFKDWVASSNLPGAIQALLDEIE